MKVDIGFWDINGNYIEDIQEVTMEEEIELLRQENAELKAYKDVNEDFKTAWEELKDELQKFKDMAKKGLDEFKDVGGCWGCGLQLQLNQDMEDITKLIAENERLKEEIISLNESWGNLKIIQNTTENKLRDTESRLISIQKSNTHNLVLLQRSNECLQEIKAIATGVRSYLEVPAPRDVRYEMDRILGCITKAEEE